MKFLKNEDNWSVVLGLFIVVVICTLYILQIPIANLNVKIKPWSDVSELFNLVSHSILGLLSLAIGFGLLLFLGAKSAQPEIKLPPFLAKFILLFLMAAGILILSSNKTVKAWQLESPLVALFIGLLLGNFTSIADKLKEVLRTEYYVKIGIILMGATLPFTTILKAGPAAIVQALIVSVVTFSTIYFVATKVFKLDNRFAATLGAGGSVCGVSASIAIGGACRAKHEHVAASISLVIVWAVIMIFALPFACKLLDLPPAIAGAWIGTSEFADAAGFAGVVFGEGSVDPYSPKAVRAMQGSQFHLELASGDLVSWTRTFQDNGLNVYGTKLDTDAADLFSTTPENNFALVMGNEGQGMQDAVAEATTQNLYIPLSGHAESLNVGVAAGVAMFALKSR